SFFDPVAASGIRYSFTGAIKRPRQVLDGGYLSWYDPETTHVFQLFVQGGRKKFVDRGPLPGGFGNLRSFTDRATAKFRMAATTKSGPGGLLLTAALGVGGGTRAARATELDRSVNASGSVLQKQINQLVRKRS